MQPIQRLRKAIQPMHQALETTELLRMMLLPGLTPYQYSQLLGWWYQVWIHLENLEQSLRPEGSLAIIAPLARAYKARNGCEQLSEIHNLRFDATARPLSDGPELPSSESSWLALVYVMRGSELGNQIQYQHLKTHFLDTSSKAALSFFEPAEAPLAWPAVLKVLNSRMETEGQTASVIKAAREVFQWLYASAVNQNTDILHPDQGRQAQL